MKFFLICILFISFSRLQAQTYRMFWNSYSLINPAASGVQYSYYGALTGRAQRLGYEGAPRNGSAIFDGKLNPLHGGAGVNYTFQKFGFTNVYSANANYSYHINLPKEHILSLGISSGINIEKIDISKFIMPPDSDPLIIADDTYTILNYKFGIFYKTNHLEAGLSSTHGKGIGNDYSNYSIPSNYLLAGSYRFDIGEKFDLKPGLFVNTTNWTDFFWSSMITVMYKDRFWAGISYASDENYGLMAGFDIMGMVRIGYSIDYIASQLNRNYGSHELILALMLK